MVRRILVPVDGFTVGQEAFEFVLDGYPDASVTVLGVLTPPKLIEYTDGEFGYFDVDAFNRTEANRQKEVEEMVERLRKKAEDNGIETESIIARGEPVDRILATAEERSINLIVMENSGPSGLGRVLFESVADAVSRKATVPVTIIS